MTSVHHTARMYTTIFNIFVIRQEIWETVNSGETAINQNKSFAEIAGTHEPEDIGRPMKILFALTKGYEIAIHCGQ